MKIAVQANAVFAPIHQCRKRYVIMKGSAGSGKSVDTAQQYILRLMADRGRNLLAMRKSEITNRKSTFAELQGAIHRMGVDRAWRITQNPMTMTCKNGNMIVFGGMNDVKQREKLKSITFRTGKLTDVWPEEATEFTQDDFEIIDDRLRGILPEGQFYQIKATFNPVSASHWLKRVFFDNPDENTFTHHSTYLDNAFVDAAYKARMMRRKEVDPDGYRIYGMGEWGETGGLILQNWEAAEVTHDIVQYDDIAIGQDFGFNHANAILLLGYKDGDVFILREIYVHELDTSEIIPMATDMPKNKLMWCDSAEPDRIKMWCREGFRAKAVEKEKGSVKAQIDWLKQRRIWVHPSCTNTIKELGQWKWQKDDKSGLYLDEPVAFGDDAMAALRYGVERWRKPKMWLY